MAMTGTCVVATSLARDIAAAGKRPLVPAVSIGCYEIPSSDRPLVNVGWFRQPGHLRPGQPRRAFDAEPRHVFSIMDQLLQGKLDDAGIGRQRFKYCRLWRHAETTALSAPGPKHGREYFNERWMHKLLGSMAITSRGRCTSLSRLSSAPAQSGSAAAAMQR